MRVRERYFFLNLREESESRKKTHPKKQKKLQAPALLTRHVVVRRDGAFYGLHALTERVGAGWLRREKLLPGKDGNSNGKENNGNGNGSNDNDDVDVSLYKPISASAALSANVPLNLMHLVWKTEHGETRYGDLDDFARKLANGRARGGRGGGSSSSEHEDAAAAWLLETLNLPRTLNYLSTAAVLLQQDRCTKNYFLLQERDRKSGSISRWSLLPGDSKTALGSDSGFGGEGEHARDYALNHADQFASPLFCDRGHPQDVAAESAEPWSGVVVEPLQDGILKKQRNRRRRRQEKKRRRRRRSVLAEEPAMAAPLSSSIAPRIEPPPANRPAAPPPLGCSANTTSLSRPDGSPASTFNALVDALLRCPPTRAMFLRRCQTLTGQLHGRVEGEKGALYRIVGNLTSRVAADAARDNEVWRGGDPNLGSRQLLEEQIPGRGRQLQEAYGKGGYVAHSLLPPPQPLPLPAAAVRVVVFPNSDSSSLLAAVSSTSPDTSLDLSGYSLRIGKREMACPGGTMSPPSGWILINGRNSNKQQQQQQRLIPALGTRLARDAKLSGLILTVEAEQGLREVGEGAAEGVVALVAPGGEVVLLS